MAARGPHVRRRDQAIFGAFVLARRPRGDLEVRTWANMDGEPVLDAIEFRGVSEEFAGEMRGRLPVREGERVSHAAREEIGRIIRENGQRLEFGLFPDDRGGAVLRVHPPGQANAPLVGKEPRR